MVSACASSHGAVLIGLQTGSLSSRLRRLTLKAGRFVLDGEGVVTDAAGVTVFDQLYGHRRYTTGRILQAFDLCFRQ